MVTHIHLHLLYIKPVNLHDKAKVILNELFYFNLNPTFKFIYFCPVWKRNTTAKVNSITNILYCAMFIGFDFYNFPPNIFC